MLSEACDNGRSARVSLSALVAARCRRPLVVFGLLAPTAAPLAAALDQTPQVPDMRDGPERPTLPSVAWFVMAPAWASGGGKKLTPEEKAATRYRQFGLVGTSILSGRAKRWGEVCIVYKE